MMTVEINSKPQSVAENQLLFFDLVRNVAMLSVILYHAVAAYSTMVPWWAAHDDTSVLADLVRKVFDVYMMPVFFFIAGFFALASLQKKGLGAFMADKFRRLGIPWLLVMLTIVPLSVYSQQVKNTLGEGVTGFGHYFVSEYLGSFGIFRLGNVPPGQITQMHLWYISLLLVFFIVFGLANQVFRRVHGKAPAAATSESTTKQTAAYIIRALLLFGVLSIASSFAALLIFPDQSWVTIDLLLQFQPTKVCVYGLAFGLGVYAHQLQWFADRTFFSQPGRWALMSVLLTAGYLFYGQEVFAQANVSQTLYPPLLLAFAAFRSFLFPAILMMLLSFACKYANRPSAINRNMAVNSFNIYLVHFFIVIFLQNLLMLWKSGPALAKIGMVLLLTLPASYGISRLIDRFPRSFAGLLVGLTVLGGLALP